MFTGSKMPLEQNSADSSVSAAGAGSAGAGAGSAAGFGLAKCLALGALALTVGCAESYIVDPRIDGGTDPNSDGGGTTPKSVWSASPAGSSDLYSESGSYPDYRQWKRDPHFLKDGTVQYVFYSGSSAQTEEWQIGFFRQDGASPTTNSPATRAIRRRVGYWDSVDLTAPSVVLNTTGSPRWSLYYAASGDSARPSYVTQIGLATSTDASATTWTQPAAPIIPAGTFTGDATTSTRADAYGATDPWVLVDGSSYIMYYAGLSCPSTCKYQILRSISTDGGKTFPPGDVVFSGRDGNADEAGGVAGPSVILRDGQFVMAYTAVRQVPEKTRESIRKALTTGSVGLAVSTDGTRFTPATVGDAPLIARVGGSTYRSQGATSPSLFADTNGVIAYFGALLEASNISYFNIGRADLSELKTQ